MEARYVTSTPRPRYSGAGTRIRTPGLIITSELLYQLSYTGETGRECRIRTYDPLLPKQVRYQTALIPVKLVFYISYFDVYVNN